MTDRWARYVDHELVPEYERIGWRVLPANIPYPRMDRYGVMMDWIGDGDPPDVRDNDKSV